MRVVTFFLLLSIQISLLNSQRTSIIALSEGLDLIKLTENSYQFISYSETSEYGRIPNNGLLFIHDNSAIMVDTPVNDSLTLLLLRWVKENTKAKITAAIITHWHIDRLGGLRVIKESGIRSYAYELTRELAKQHNYPIPEIGFFDTLNVSVGDLEVKCRFLGAGHSLDNSLVWIPSEKILFGGCLVKAAANKGLGNIDDGNLNAWPVTIRAAQLAYPDAKIVIPGHGPSGGTELFDHTYQLMIECNAD